MCSHLNFHIKLTFALKYLHPKGPELRFSGLIVLKDYCSTSIVEENIFFFLLNY